jgi:hypothetical protein
MRFSQGPFFSRFLSVTISAASVFFIGSALHAQDFYLQNGDHVTFDGDSVTAQRYSLATFRTL